MSLATQVAGHPVKENLRSLRFHLLLAALEAGLGYRQNLEVDGS